MPIMAGADMQTGNGREEEEDMVAASNLTEAIFLTSKEHYQSGCCAENPKRHCILFARSSLLLPKQPTRVIN